MSHLIIHHTLRYHMYRKKGKIYQYFLCGFKHVLNTPNLLPLSFFGQQQTENPFEAKFPILQCPFTMNETCANCCYR